MITKVIIWVQLISTLLLLADAYLPASIREKYDTRIKLNAQRKLEHYLAHSLNRDLLLVYYFFRSLGLVILIALATIAFNHSILKEPGWFSALAYLLLFCSFSVAFNIAIERFSNHLKHYLDLLISLPITFILCKAPKGPIYVVGFGLLLISHCIQLVIEYRK